MKKWRRRTATLLAVVMALNLCMLPAGAEETDPQDTGIMSLAEEASLEEDQPGEAQTTEAPQTEAPQTQASETEAPQTQAPETEAPQTQTPETEASQTEAPQTQAPETEAPQTQTPETEAPQTVTEPETEEESQTETGTEEEGYVWENEEISVQVKLPERIVLPENAVLKAEAEKKDSDNRKKSIELVEKAETGLYFGEYLVYDIHFEADGQELDLADYIDGSELEEDEIEVVFEFTEPVFEECNVKDEMVKAYHIKDLTPEELDVARELAKLENPNVEDPEIDEQRAVELKAYAEMTPDASAVTRITFYTDGFSDYVFAVTADQPETEETQAMPGESEGANQGDVQTEATETGSQTEATESEDEANAIMPVAEGTEEARRKLTLGVGQLGNTSETEYAVTLTPQGAADFKDVKLGDGTTDAEISTADGKLTVTVNVAGEALSTVTLTGLSDGTYTIDAGGSAWKDNQVLAGSSDKYTSLYRLNGQNVYKNAPQTVTINGQPDASGTDNQTAEIYNVYTKADLTVVDREGKTVSSAGGEYVLSAGKTILDKNLTVTKGRKQLTGLPVGDITLKDGTLTSGTVTGAITYNWKIKNAQTAPAGYVDLSSEAAFGFASNAGLAVSAASALTTAPTKVKLLAKDDSGSEINGLTMKITDNTTGETWKETYASGDTVTGRFIVGHEYKITQEGRPAGYVKAKGKDSYTLTVSNTAEVQGTKENQHTVNKPIVVKVADVLKNDTGRYVAGGKLQILASDKKTAVVSGITSHDGLYTLTKEQREKIEPDKKYYLAEVKAPQGHYAAATMAEFSLNADGEATVSLKYVTTKLVFTRYDYAYSYKKNGKTVFEDRKPLAGAVIRLVDSQGNVADEWTTTESSYICEGKVNVGETYTLVEVSTPEGSATPSAYTFTTKLGTKFGAQNQERTVSINEDGYISPYTNVAVQAPRYGRVEVAKRVALNGKAKKLSDSRTFYCGIYKDQDMSKEHLYKEMQITMTPDDVFGTNTFVNVLPGVYYLAETDGSGNRITGQNGEEAFTAAVAGNPLRVIGGTKASGNILNNYTKINTDMQDLSDSEQTAWSDVGSSYTGTTDDSGNAVTAENARTNDPTRFLPYIIMIVVALAALVGVLVYKKKKK